VHQCAQACFVTVSVSRVPLQVVLSRAIQEFLICLNVCELGPDKGIARAHSDTGGRRLQWLLAAGAAVGNATMRHFGVWFVPCTCRLCNLGDIQAVLKQSSWATAQHRCWEPTRTCSSKHGVDWSRAPNKTIAIRLGSCWLQPQRFFPKLTSSRSHNLLSYPSERIGMICLQCAAAYVQ
jgi:hypothetical protein